MSLFVEVCFISLVMTLIDYVLQIGSLHAQTYPTGWICTRKCMNAVHERKGAMFKEHFRMVPFEEE